MAYPSMERYQEALRFPDIAFVDPGLKLGRIALSGLGTPEVVSGGFALTYAVKLKNGRKVAVRCFHRGPTGIERRYPVIERRLRELASDYFVKFEFQPTGLRVDDDVVPIVKMDWAEGETLGEFVERHHAEPAKLANLITSLSKLAGDLEGQGIAHGDIQEGNLMVADEGRRVQLIDYDGIYLPELAHLGSSEKGHCDFQHPGRDGSVYNATLDRFSFIALHLALSALRERSQLWKDSQSGAGVLVLKANDYEDPASSPTLAAIERIPRLTNLARRFAEVCVGPFSMVPTLQDFIGTAAVGLTREAIAGNARGSSRRAGYIGNYDVLNAADYPAFDAAGYGRYVELVGRIESVFPSKGHVFVNFGPRGSVAITLWASVLKKGGTIPTKGQWVSARGTIQPPRPDKQKFPAASLSVQGLSYIVVLTESEARYRLTPRERSESHTSDATRPLLNNTALLAQLRSPPAMPSPPAGVPSPAVRGPIGGAGPSTAGLTKNQQLLQKINTMPAAPVEPGPPASTPRPSPIVRVPAAVPPRPPARAAKPTATAVTVSRPAPTPSTASQWPYTSPQRSSPRPRLRWFAMVAFALLVVLWFLLHWRR